MSEREFATYSANATKTRLDDPGNQVGLQQGTAHSAGYAVSTSRFIGAVREGRGFYIPEVITEEAYRSNPDLFSAAFGHAENLSDVQRLLGEALDLIRALSEVPFDDCHAQEKQYEATRLKIEKKLRKASTRLVKHGCRHTNLFLLYFDLRRRIDAAKDSSAPAYENVQRDLESVV